MDNLYVPFFVCEPRFHEEIELRCVLFLWCGSLLRLLGQGLVLLGFFEDFFLGECYGLYDVLILQGRCENGLDFLFILGCKGHFKDAFISQKDVCRLVLIDRPLVFRELGEELLHLERMPHLLPY